MKTVSIRDAKSHLHSLAREVEGGETIVVTRRGKPVLDLAPHRRVGRGINWGGRSIVAAAREVLARLRGEKTPGRVTDFCRRQGQGPPAMATGPRGVGEQEPL